MFTQAATLPWNTGAGRRFLLLTYDLTGAPTMIIEVLSPSTALKDFNEKFNLYQRYGVQEYWIVDPGNRTVHVYALQEGIYQVRNLYSEQDHASSQVFQELKIPLDRLFDMETRPEDTNKPAAD